MCETRAKEEKNMKKNKTFTIKTILSFAAAALFLACSNLGGGSVSNAAGGPNAAGGQGGAQAPVMVTVNGSLAFGGAYPEQIAALVENSGADGLDGIARSAFPDAASSGLTYSVYALEDLPAGSTDTPLRYEGTVAVDNKSYTVGIPVLTGKKYNVFAEVKNDGITVLSGKSAKVIEAPSGESSFVTDANITLAATQTSGKKGCVQLTVNVQDADISSARAVYTDPSDGSQKTIDGEFYLGEHENTPTFSVGIDGEGEADPDNGLASGAYLMTFEFYSEAHCAGNLLYSFTEAVNVFDNMTTSRWVKNGGEPWLTPDSSGNIACKITAAMVTGFGLTDIYVDTSAADDSGSGSFMHPKKTFAKAVDMLVNADADYTIHITGTLAETSSINSQMAHYIPNTISAKSLTLCGESEPVDGVPQDALSGGGAKSVLYIAAAVPITIRNLKIMNGLAPLGGGIGTGSADFTLTLAEGAYISGNESTLDSYGGGGIYFNGTELIMLDGVVIEGNKAAGHGGGVYLCAGKRFTMNGGVIKGNEATGNGGGVYMTKGTFTMTGGVIGDDTKDTPANSNSGKCSNKASKGAGVYIYGVSGSESQTKADLLGGTIAYNYATVNGGGVYAALCRSVTIKNTVKCNGAVCGGGVYTVSSSNCNTYVYLDGCSILKNKAYPTDITKEGGGALVVGNSSTKVNCSVTLKGAASIPCTGKYENDIQLGATESNSAILTVNGKLTAAGIIGTITPLSYTEEHAVLDGSTSEYYKFAVTPQTSPAQDWAVDSDGKLLKATPVTSTNISSLSFSNLTDYVLRADSSLSIDSNYESLMNKLDTITNPGEIVLDLSKTNDIFKGITYSKYLSKNISVVVMPENATVYSPRCFYVGSESDYTSMKLKEIIIPEGNNYFCSENGILYDKNKTKLLRYPPAKADATFTLPNTVTALGEAAFFGCPNITQVTNLSQITTLSNVLNEFFYCTSLTTADLRGVTSSTLTQNIFRGCTSLKTVYLSSNISTFGQNCFYGCSALEEIHFARSTPPYLDYDNFKNCPSSITFYVPAGSKSAYLDATGSSGFAGSNNPWANLDNFADMIVEE